MLTQAIHYQHGNKTHAIANPEFFQPGYHMLHSNVIEPKEQKDFPRFTAEHNFTCYKGSQIMSWHTLKPIEKRNALMKTRFLCNEIDSRLSQKIYAYIETFASQKGWKGIIVHAAPSGIGFYRSLGFEYENAKIADTGMVLYLMMKGI